MNNSTDCSSESVDDYHLNSQERILLMVVLIIICLLGVVGNGWIVFIICKTKQMRTPYYLLVTNLIVCDVIRSLLVMPLTIKTLAENEWVLGNILCQLQGLFTVGLNSVTLLTITALAAEKYYSIVHPLGQSFTHVKCYLVILGIWIISMLYGGAPLISRSNYHYRSVYFACGLPKSGTQFLMYLFSVTILIIIPMGVMLFCYWNIYKTLKTNFQNLKTMVSSNSSLLSSLRIQRQMVILNLLTLAIFIICWLPVLVAMVVAITVSHERDVPRGLSAAALWCAFTASFWNPVLYITRNSKMRNETRKILLCLAIPTRRN